MTLASVREMAFIALTLGLLVLLFVIMIALARVFKRQSVADLLDWKPTRSYELEAELEGQDVQQMIDAQNELRRKRGAKEITEADVQRQAREDEAVRARGSGPFAPLDPDLRAGPLPPPRNPAPRKRSKSKPKPKPKPKSGPKKR
jgi:hypothetical protein